MNVKAWLVAVVLGAMAASWAIGRVLHLLGARHSGAQILAEVVVLSVVGLALVGRRMAAPTEARESTEALRARVRELRADNDSLLCGPPSYVTKLRGDLAAAEAELARREERGA